MVDHVIYNLGRQIGTLGLSDLEKAVVKATYFDENPPKEKWVAELVSQTQSFMGEAKKSSSDILDCLVRRMRSDHWQVILKAMIVIHRLLREGGYAFSEAISQMDADSLSVQNSLDAYTTMTSTQSRLVRNYEKYLLKKLDVYREIGFSLEKKFNSDGVEWVKNLSDKTLIEFAKKVQIQLDFLLDCNISSRSAYSMHPIEAAMFVLLIKDSFNLYTYQSLVVFGILDRFQRWGKSTAAEALEFYNAFIVQNQRYKSWGFKASDAELIDKNLLPDFDNVPTKILDTLTLYLESGEILSDEENPKRLSEIMGVEKLIVNETKKKGKKKKKKKNAEVESSTDGDAEITPKNNSPPKVSHNARKSLDLLGFAAPTAKSKPAQVQGDDFESFFSFGDSAKHNEKKESSKTYSEQDSFDLLSFDFPMQSNSTNTQKTFSSTNNGDFVDLLGIPVNLKPAEQALNQTSKSTQLGLSKAPANYSKQNVVFDPFEDLFK